MLITPTKLLTGLPFGWITALLHTPLGILLSLKYNPPSALLSTLPLGPSPVTQEAIITFVLVTEALIYE